MRVDGGLIHMRTHKTSSEVDSCPAWVRAKLWRVKKEKRDGVLLKKLSTVSSSLSTW